MSREVRNPVFVQGNCTETEPLILLAARALLTRIQLAINPSTQGLQGEDRKQSLP